MILIIHFLNTKTKNQHIYTERNQKKSDNISNKFWKNNHQNSKKEEKSTEKHHKIIEKV